jgi:hypothetical protein
MNNSLKFNKSFEFLCFVGAGGYQQSPYAQSLNPYQSSNPSAGYPPSSNPYQSSNPSSGYPPSYPGGQQPPPPTAG